MESDDELIKRYLSGDEPALKVLIDRYTPSIYNFSRRFVDVDNTEDIVQDIFIKSWKALKKFDNKRASFKTWVFTIARNRVTDYLRKKKSLPFSALIDEKEDFADKIEDVALLPDEALAQFEDTAYLNKILDEIPVHYREVLIYHYQEDMTFDEIGKLMGKPLNTVKSYHQRALTLLRKFVAPKKE